VRVANERSSAGEHGPVQYSATDDLDPRFAASVEAAGSDGGESDGAITLSWQDCLQNFVPKMFGVATRTKAAGNSMSSS
jgi:hypothetical protein